MDYSRIKTYADEAFSEHTVTKLVDVLTPRGRVTTYYCGTEGTIISSFYISILPRAILVSGDIGDLLIDSPSGGEEWLESTLSNEYVSDYLLGKSAQARAAKELDPMEALEALGELRDEIASDYGNTTADRDILAIKNIWLERDPSGKDLDKWIQAWQDIMETHPPLCLGWDSNTLWCYAALCWWKENK